MPDIEDFRSELQAQIDRALRQGRPHVEINAGELHRVVGGYPSSSHRMPICCQAMRDEKRPEDSEVFAPDSGDGASLTICYRFPR